MTTIACMNLLYRLKKAEIEAREHLSGFTENDLAVIMAGIEEAIETVSPLNPESGADEFLVPAVDHLKHVCSYIETYMQQDWHGSITVPHILATFAYHQAEQGISLLEQMIDSCQSEEWYAKASQACIDAFEALSFIETAESQRAQAMTRALKKGVASKGGRAKDAKENQDERNRVLEEYAKIIEGGVTGSQVVHGRSIRLRKKNGTINYTNCTTYIYYMLVERLREEGKRPNISQGADFVSDSIKRFEKSLKQAELAAKFAKEDADKPASPWWPVSRAA